ncbi:MAG TPA: lysylphosphatidylglycerol synthase transmembrane domain-containing protein [Kofleriaceae bacterium]|nr:lysylphosphatidylglycerol synthase transmembrane domain-containing protein [Kofleriaceae bacterium]
MKRWGLLALRIVAIAAIAIWLFIFLRDFEWKKLGKAIEHARVWPLVLAAALNFVCLWGKAACWHVVLAPRYVVSTTALFRYTIAAFAASVIAPARAGELIRVWVLKNRHGVPVTDCAAVAVTEKLLDGLTMMMLVAPVPWIVPGLPSWVGHAMFLCGAIAVVIFAAVWIAVGKIPAGGGANWFTRFIGGMHVVRSPKRLVLAAAALMLTWLADLAMINLVLYAVGIDLPIGAGLLVLFTLNLTIAVPSTPGQVGALEAGVLAATRLLHIDDAQAFAFALLYHVLQILPLLVVALLTEGRLMFMKPTADGAEAVRTPQTEP